MKMVQDQQSYVNSTKTKYVNGTQPNSVVVLRPTMSLLLCKCLRWSSMSIRSDQLLDEEVSEHSYLFVQDDNKNVKK